MGNSPEGFWARRRISPESIAFGDAERILESAWHEVEYVTAKNIFEKIKDGRMYCLQAKRFEDNFEFMDAILGDFRTTQYSALPELSVGYKGSLSLVRQETWQAPPVPWPGYRRPSWREIGDGIIARIREDFKMSNLMKRFVKWFVKDVLARVLYLPDENPDFWGKDAF